VAHLPARSTLLDVVAALARPERGPNAVKASTIFALRPWDPGSLAVVLDEEPIGGRAPSMPDFAYLLEVDSAADVLEAWASSRSGSAPTPEEGAEALIHFAAHKTHLPATCGGGSCGRPPTHRCSACTALVCSRHAVVSAASVECPACAAKQGQTLGPSPRGRTSGSRARLVLCASLELAGITAIVLGWAAQALALWAAGTCLLVVGACVWLGGLVQRTMAGRAGVRALR